MIQKPVIPKVLKILKPSTLVSLNVLHSDLKCHCHLHCHISLLRKQLRITFYNMVSYVKNKLTILWLANNIL